MSAILDFLRQRCAAGPWSLGQLAIDGRAVRHTDDRTAADLESFSKPEDARELAKYDDAGSYRPLKTAPNLRHGWRLELASIEELRLALDFFYPAALGTWIAYADGRLPAVPLRDTLGRQSGMYRVTQLITDFQADELILRTCDPQAGCLRHQLWDVSPGRTSPLRRPPVVSASAEVPVLCAEACNLLVAACRPIAKQNLPKTDAQRYEAVGK